MSLFESASLCVTPNGTKASKLYAIKPTSGAGDLSVVRATTATRVNSAGLIESVAVNVPRLDYSNGSCPSILVEPQRTNLFLRSQEFDNASWPTFRSSVTANATISPDGNTNAEKLIQESTTTDSGGIYQNLSLSNSTVYTYSVYLKAAGYNFGLLRVNGSKYAWFDLSNGVVGSITGGGSSSIQNVGNGWYKCIFTFTTTSTVGEPHIYIAQTNGSSIVSSADGVKGIFAYGAQLEAGSYATSYIPTVASSVTRNADVISKTGISSLIGQTEGTMFLDFNFNYSDSTTQVLLKASQSNDANSVGIEVQNNVLKAIINSSSSNIANLTNTISTGRIKCAIAYKSNDMVFYVNGVQVGSDTSGNINFAGNVDMLTLGHFNLLGTLYFQSSRPFNSAILWKERLTNTELASLTTL